MLINVINQKKLLYKQKKLFLLNMYAFSLLASGFSMNFNNSLKNQDESNRIVTETVMDTYETKALNRTLVCSQVASELETNLNEIKKSEKAKTQNIYYDFPCPEELQDHIFKISKQYDVDFELIMTIIHRESGGKWDTNGVISPTNDYGLPQINICNAKYIEEQLGYSLDDILNDPYKSIEAQALLLKDILNIYDYTDEIDYKNVFGTYNGWLNWEDKVASCEYAEGCMQIYQEKFNGVSRKLN